MNTNAHMDSASLQVVASTEVQVEGGRVLNGGLPVATQLAQTNIEQGEGFKAEKSILTEADGSTVTKYRLDVDGTHTVATIKADGTATLSTTRGGITDNALEGDAGQKFAAAIAASKGEPTGTTAKDDAKDFAAIMDRAFADNKISPSELMKLTELNNAAQDIPARGPRTAGLVR